MDIKDYQLNGKKIFWIISVLVLGLLSFFFLQEYFSLNLYDKKRTIHFFENGEYDVFKRNIILFIFSWSLFFYLAWHAPAWKRRPNPHFTFPKWLMVGIKNLLLFLPAALVFLIQPQWKISFGFWSVCFFTYAIALICTLLQSGRENTVDGLINEFAKNLLMSGVIYAFLARFILVTDYPFPQYWSEGNRFYDYSTLLGDFRYNVNDGEPVEAFITPGMAFPWSIPFIFSQLSIKYYRLYYQLMWIFPPVLFGVLLFSRSCKSDHSINPIIILTLWATLFLEQGPVYTPLVLAAIMVLFAHRSRFSLALILILVASYYAHISRWTWSYTPGIWAALLSFLNIEKKKIQEDWKRALFKPVLMGLSGLTGGLLLPSITNSPMAKSLVNPLPFTARQPLLWDRLLPNSTYSPGILLGILWAALPALVFIFYQIFYKKAHYHWMQLVAISFSLIIFFTVGIIASAKIGGGSNLHNLDMFLITIVLLVGVVYKNKSCDARAPEISRDLRAIIFLFVAIGSVSYTLRASPPSPLPDDELIEETLFQVNTWVERYAKAGEVLFIDQRQLLTFGYIENVPLVQEYEKKLLMEMAMSRREDYFTDFYRDLASGRFALIVNEPSGLFIKGSDDAFSEENNAYVEWVTFPLLCNYYPAITIKEVGLEILLPRKILPVNDPRCLPYLQH